MNHFLMFYAPFIVLIGATRRCICCRTDGRSSKEAD